MSQSRETGYIGGLKDFYAASCGGSTTIKISNSSNKILVGLERISVYLQTSAVVGNRQVTLKIFDKSGNLLIGVMGHAQAASQNQYHNFSPNWTDDYDGGTHHNYPLPSVYLDRGEYMEITDYANDANDAFTVRAKLRVIKSDERI